MDSFFNVAIRDTSKSTELAARRPEGLGLRGGDKPSANRLHCAPSLPVGLGCNDESRESRKIRWPSLDPPTVPLHLFAVRIWTAPKVLCTLIFGHSDGAVARSSSLVRQSAPHPVIMLWKLSPPPPNSRQLPNEARRCTPHLSTSSLLYVLASVRTRSGLLSQYDTTFRVPPTHKARAAAGVASWI